MSKTKQKSAQDKSFDSAQDRQDEIFRRMSPAESLRLAGKFYQFARVLNKLGEDYDGTNGTRRIVKQNRRYSR